MKANTIHVPDAPQSKPASVQAAQEQYNMHAYAVSDHRPEAIIQRKLQKLSAQSPQQQALAQLQRVINNGAEVIQLQLQRNRLNVVGEIHSESATNAARLAEKRYAREQLGKGSKFWYENEFGEPGIKLPGMRARRYGDPFDLRALNYFAYLREHCHDFLQGANNANAPASLKSLYGALSGIYNNIDLIVKNLKKANRSAFNGLSITELKGLKAKVKSDFDILVPIDKSFELPDAVKQQVHAASVGQNGEVYRNNLVLEANRLKRQQAANDLAAMIPDYTLLQGRFDGIVQAQGKQPGFTLPIGETFKHDSDYSEGISIDRSMAMHNMANEYATRVGVWKIGDKHVGHILNRAQHGGNAQLNYNLLTRDEFRGLVYP